MIKQKYVIFYAVVLVSFLFVLASNPFLRYPYDMIHHLIVIDDLYMQLTYAREKLVGIFANDIYIMIPTGEYEATSLARPRYLWHYGWGWLFHLLHIDSTQLILRAKIIHVIQTFISLFSIYYFSKVVIRNVFKNIDTITLKWLSSWSVFIWLTIYATASVAYHQVWMMWYSVNYQISLPLFWYMTALTLVFLLEETSVWKKVFIVIQVMLISRIILQIHSMEFLYYLMYMAVFSLVYIDKVYFYAKRYIYIFVPFILGLGYLMKKYQPDNSQIFDYMHWEKLPLLYEKIMREGGVLLSGYNRASASVNELMYFVGIVGIPFLFYVVLQYYRSRQTDMHLRMLFFVAVSSLFVLIPLYQFSGGLFGVITSTMVVNRLYYSASLFVVLPIVVYAVTQRYQLKILYINLLLSIALLFVYGVSTYSNVLHHNYYKNIQSVQHSFKERSVGFNLSQEQIDRVGKLIVHHEQAKKTHKKLKFYARADVAFVIKYIYHKNVYWEGRRANPNHVEIYKNNTDNADYEHVLFTVPRDFPPYKPYS